MSCKIRVLDEHTINKIAAGEVIENPASVVKELLDNALDAGATEICVEIKGGGRQLIRITDNGCGMDKDDALLSLERHATSKLKAIEDLNALHTMGFRGEALPSIASISKSSLHTQAEESGTRILVEGGRILCCEEVPRHATGTTIEVNALFYNVPVRKKFQRSPTYDATEVQKVVTVTALAKRSVCFTFLNNGKEVFSTKGEERIADLLGGEFAEQLYPIDEKKGERHLRGFIGFPTATRQNRTGQYLFINGRPVTAPLISYAVKEGYGTAIAHNRHPVFVLFLELPPGAVDFNVHPQKKEVRFREAPALREFVFSSIDHALQKVGVVEHFEPVALPTPNFTYQAPVFPEIRVTEPTVQEMPELFEPKPEPVKVLCSLSAYLLIEHPEGGVAFVDQRAARARIVFEEMTHKRACASQSLLLPITMEMTPLEVATLQEVLPDLETLGFQLSFSQNTLLIGAVPTLLQDADIETFIRESVTALRDFHDRDVLEKVCKKQLAKLASCAARPASLPEAKALVQTLLQCETPSHCPRGNPTIWRLTETEIAKYFSRP